ncbi:hypothetical protein E2562_001979 [Oryza meyeriana var. granulata]|uniref:DUF834 domain-containing protein n=1 Tax=Oryza meyeriana var. granulata TaxID=110450 RepID=A0A6G1C3G3_9ORYZ|nr:hypothetical protein E2562_001979 [Oryza meyeriana var. granulata]
MRTAETAELDDDAAELAVLNDGAAAPGLDDGEAGGGLGHDGGGASPGARRRRGGARRRSLSTCGSRWLRGATRRDRDMARGLTGDGDGDLLGKY